MTPSMCVASLAWSLLALGFLLRRRRKVHVRFMLSGIGIDIGLVLYLQITRGAVQKALALDLALLQQTHIAFSTVALLLYFPTIFFGARLLTINAASDIPTDSAILIDSSAALVRQRLRKLHIRFALSAFVARTLGLLFMFSMWKNP